MFLILGVCCYIGPGDFLPRFQKIASAQCVGPGGAGFAPYGIDIDGDGGLTLADAIAALKTIVGLGTNSLDHPVDIDGDYVIGLPEAIYVLQEVAGSIRPSFCLTSVPPYENPRNQRLRGKITGWDPGAYGVAVYIRVGDNYWTKPYYTNPVSAIDDHGNWSCNIVTGGYDRYATEIVSFLLPKDATPPVCGPCFGPPDIPESVALIRAAPAGAPDAKRIAFAGYNWRIKRSDFPYGPGPNYFSDRDHDVFVDEDGLHLTITKRDDKWWCTEVILEKSFGYGAYRFTTQGRVDFDPEIVLGMFTWDTKAKDNYFREIDIEFGRFGTPDLASNGQFVIQPCTQCPGCGNRCNRFRVDSAQQQNDLTHYMVWGPGRVEFRTYSGCHAEDAPPDSALLWKWTYTGQDVPVPGEETIRINFWLFSGHPPSSGRGDEFVIRDFAWY